MTNSKKGRLPVITFHFVIIVVIEDDEARRSSSSTRTSKHSPQYQVEDALRPHSTYRQIKSKPLPTDNMPTCTLLASAI